jgi:hypothetical protein
METYTILLIITSIVLFLQIVYHCIGSYCNKNILFTAKMKQIRVITGLIK